MKTYNLHNVNINLIDDCGNPDEIFGDNYKIFDKQLAFSPNDVIIDIGANVGFFTVMMAKIFPYAQIYSFEPMTVNYQKLLANIEANELKNVYPFHCAVAGKSGLISILYDRVDPGGSSSFVTRHENHDEEHTWATTLDAIIDLFAIQKCRLLKIDCEGMEYDILYNTTHWDRIENVVGEFHLNDKLIAEGHHWDKLSTYVSERTNMMYYEWCYMAQ